MATHGRREDRGRDRVDRSLRAGLVGQRTRVHDTDLDIQRGVLAQVFVGPTTLGLDWFNPGSDDSFVVAVFEIGF